MKIKINSLVRYDLTREYDETTRKLISWLSKYRPKGAVFYFPDIVYIGEYKIIEKIPFDRDLFNNFEVYVANVYYATYTIREARERGINHPFTRRELEFYKRSIRRIYSPDGFYKIYKKYLMEDYDFKGFPFGETLAVEFMLRHKTSKVKLEL